MKRLLLLILLQIFVLRVAVNAQSAEQATLVNCYPVNVDQTYSVYLDTVGSWLNATNCPSAYGGGEEVVLQFTAPCTNTFIVKVIEPFAPYLHPLAIRNSTGSCAPGGFVCMTPFSTVSNIPQYTLLYEIFAIEDSTYDILIEYDYWTGNFLPANLGVTIKTPHVEDVHLLNITPDSLSIAWSGVFDEVLLEYGPNGFVPGQDTTPGVLGTVITPVTSPYTLIGLDNDSSYSFYLRDRCANSYSANSVVTRVRIPRPDSLIVQLSPCPNSSFTGTFYNEYAKNPGSWLTVNCASSCPQSSPEVIRRFVPDSSGIHIFSKTGQGSTYPTFGCFYKEAALGLDENNWNCIGLHGQNTPWSYAFGPLVAGTPYYIMLKVTQDLGPGCSNPGLFSTTFRVECQGTCPILSNHQIITPTTNSLTFLLRQGTTLGYFVIEYGLAGFTPGADTLPGVGGTIIMPTAIYSNHVVSGLQPGTTYDFYFRQYCDVTGSFSSNSQVRSGTTLPLCSVAPVAITSNRPNNAVCAGQTIALIRQGGQLSPGAYFAWYKDSCNSTQIGTGDYLNVLPDSSRFYFVRPVDTCAVLPCIQIFVTVNPLPQVSLTNPPTQDICLGDTVIMQATIDSSWTYTWRRNGINLNVDSIPTYGAFSGGLYSVMVTDSNNCTGSSQNSKVRVVCFPPQDPVERVALFAEETNNSIVVTPNPGNGIFNCQFSKQAGECRLSVYNSLGEKIIFRELSGEAEQIIFDISDQPQGMYLLIIETPQQVLSQKLFVVSE